MAKNEKKIEPDNEPVEVSDDQTVTEEMKAQRKAEKEKVRFPVDLVPMINPNTGRVADVHPREVDNWKAHGWKENKPAAKKSQGEKAEKKE